MTIDLLSEVRAGVLAKTGCAVVVSAGLMFAGSICANAEDAKPCNSGDTWCNVKKVASGAKDVTDYFTAAKTVVEIVELVGKITGKIKQGPDPLDRVIEAIQLGFDNDIWVQINIALGKSVGVADKLIDKINTGDTITDADNTDADGAVTGITNDFTTNAVFSFPYNETAQKRGMDVLGYTMTDLDKRGPNLIYDWRLGISALMRVISYRLVVLGAFHPNFRNDGYAWGEIDNYRKALNIHYEMMLKGVRCGVAPPHGTALPEPLYRCADIHTGLSTGSDGFGGSRNSCDYITVWNLFWWGGGPPIDSGQLCGGTTEDEAEVFADLRRDVVTRVPLYEVKAMMDALYSITHPMFDLAEENHTVPSFSDPSLCLESTGEKAQLWTCDGDAAQNWVYDRQSGTISNPDLGKCLEVTYGAHAFLESFPVGLADCFGDQWQQWTYDPETHVLLSAMGPVLTIWMKTRKGLEHPFDYIRWMLSPPQAGDPVESLPLLSTDTNNDVFPKQQWQAVGN